MENSTIKLRHGKCRFCLSEGKHKDIMKEYNSNGIREVYHELFQECFNLYLCTNSARSSLICGECVRRLRDAISFRVMVVESEQQLINTLDEKETLFVNMGGAHEEVDVKVEQAAVPDEPNAEMDQVSFTDEYYDDFSDAMSKSDEELVDGEADLVARFPPPLLRPLPTISGLENDRFFRTLESLRGKIITAASIRNLLDPKRNRVQAKVYVTEKLAHVNNVSTILENSNLTAFKTNRRKGHPCFYCSRVCDTFHELHDHQATEKCKINIRQILSKTPTEALVVYVHVTDLKCTICDEKIPNINELKTHLVRVHKKQIYSQHGDRVIPFKLTKNNEYECLNCGFNFETFGAMERHMNVHYRNYICEQCGAGYVTKNRLKVHLRCSHVSGSYPCEICKKVFDTQYKYKSHVDYVHKNVKKNKCPKCPERFTDYFDRHKHMVDVHGDPPLRYKCKVCDTAFKRRYALSCHMKRRHLEVKDVQCNVCSYKCYNRTELKAHMVKHNGERTYECVVCKKLYARKKTLKEHMRIHTNDRRFVCVVCGQAFVQNCSLKGHMKTHHADQR